MATTAGAQTGSFERIRQVTSQGGTGNFSTLDAWYTAPRYSSEYLVGEHHGSRLFSMFEALNTVDDKYIGSGKPAK